MEGAQVSLRMVEPRTHHRRGLCPRKITIGNGSSFLAILSSTSTGGTKINETFLLSENCCYEKNGFGAKN